MKDEIDSVKRNQTWELAHLPQGHCAITLKWVYKLKRNEAGEIMKHKARLVVRGFVQQERGSILMKSLLPSCEWNPWTCSLHWQLRRGGKSTTWT
jgi:hypothetical protein